VRIEGVERGGERESVRAREREREGKRDNRLRASRVIMKKKSFKMRGG